MLFRSAWDVHQFVVPIYGSTIGLSASAIGVLLASYSAATFVIRVAVPWLARRVPEWPMILASHVVGCVMYLLYPLTESLPVMMVLSFLLGMGLGVSQPIVLALLHRLAPPDRTGEAVGLRMVLINGTQTLLGVIVLAIALLMLFLSCGLRLGYTTLLLSHVAFSLPFVVVTVYARLVSFNERIVEAARDLGASESQMVRSVMLPVIFPALLAGFGRENVCELPHDGSFALNARALTEAIDRDLTGGRTP